MFAPVAPVARLLRACLAGVAVTVVAVVAHALGHGTPPPSVALLPVALAVAGIALAASGRRWTVTALFGGIGVAQVGVHALSVYITGDAHLSATMVLAHLVATMLTSAALAYGERLWWRLWQWAIRHVLPSVPEAMPSVRRLLRLEWTGRLVVRGRYAAVVSVRGPPLS